MIKTIPRFLKKPKTKINPSARCLPSTSTEPQRRQKELSRNLDRFVIYNAKRRKRGLAAYDYTEQHQRLHGIKPCRPNLTLVA